jgi:hypothetical protein
MAATVQDAKEHPKAPAGAGSVMDRSSKTEWTRIADELHGLEVLGWPADVLTLRIGHMINTIYADRERLRVEEQQRRAKQVEAYRARQR